MFYCEKNKLKTNIKYEPAIVHNGALLEVDNLSVFFDYSDSPLFITYQSAFDLYFKRSLRKSDRGPKIFPLNFNVPISYKPFLLLSKLKSEFLMARPNRIELVRALDRFSWVTNSSHHIFDFRKFPDQVSDNKGSIVFCTRLWNPENNAGYEEKNRREKQNQFRIEACRIIKSNFKSARVGLFPDEYSKKQAPDILLDENLSKKKAYLKSLKSFDIGVADAGLKDSPGWKIGEYLLNGMAVVTTPLDICVDDFTQNKNYKELSNRSAASEIPEMIEELLVNNNYLRQGKNNLEWAQEYISPLNYFSRILKIIEESNLNFI
ncbi:hypothetical protein BST86_07640 [Nonlabens agnitus]|uniref:Exostosin GT47 domain-containing protein n=1 Tax=Nonlabens agnitus TaxID=870484 RepID=A0A2S9WU33_9FLAO|nr:hypothetical protein BST86_07640 [Nonlabens agnitus]